MSWKENLSRDPEVQVQQQLVGAGIGLATFGVQKLIGLFDHSDTDIADVKI